MTFRVLEAYAKPFSHPGVATPGVKHDEDKLRLDLLPWGAVLACAETLTHGAKKYGVGNWRRVPDGRSRFLAASLRHVIAYARGEWLDEESGLPHLGHALASLMFLYELAENDPGLTAAAHTRGAK